MSMSRAAPKAEAKPGGEGLASITGAERSVKLSWLIGAASGVFAISAFFVPDSVQALFGSKALGDAVPVEQKVWARFAVQYLALHVSFVAFGHFIITGHGAVETTLRSTHHLSAIRTVMVGDALWAALSCIALWILIMPQMSSYGYDTTPILVLSVVLAIIGLASHFASRGEEFKALGGLIRMNANAAQYVMPKFEPKNFIFFVFIVVDFVFCPIFLFAPDFMVKRCGVDGLLGTDATAFVKVTMQFVGIMKLNHVLTLIGLLASGVLALEYCMVRFLWVWSTAGTVVMCLFREAHVYLGLPTAPAFLGMLWFAFLMGFSYHSLAQFGQKSMKEKIIGRV